MTVKMPNIVADGLILYSSDIRVNKSEIKVNNFEIMA